MCYYIKEIIRPFIVGLINVLSLNELILTHLNNITSYYFYNSISDVT